MLMVTPPWVSLCPPAVLLHPAARAASRRSGCSSSRCWPPRPSRAIQIRSGSVEAPGRLTRASSIALMPRRGARVDAGDVVEGVQLPRPGRGEGERRLTAGGVADVVGLHVVPERAALDDPERPGRRATASTASRATLDPGGAVVRGRARVDRHVVAVAREPGVAGRLRAEGDRQQPPAVRQLRADPRRREVRLVPAGPGVAGDVDADRPERRAAAARRPSRSGSAPGTGRSRSR